MGFHMGMKTTWHQMNYAHISIEWDLWCMYFKDMGLMEKYMCKELFTKALSKIQTWIRHIICESEVQIAYIGYEYRNLKIYKKLNS